MVDETERKRLKDLEARIEGAKKRRETGSPKMENEYTGAGQAWRMVIELVTGMSVGFAIGYGLDALFGTLPLFLVIFCLLGFAAGIRVMMETARQAQNQAGAQVPDERDEA